MKNIAIIEKNIHKFVVDEFFKSFLIQYIRNMEQSEANLNQTIRVLDCLNESQKKRIAMYEEMVSVYKEITNTLVLTDKAIDKENNK